MAAAVGNFNYFQWKPQFETEKPYYLYTDPPPGYPNANFATKPGSLEKIYDVRGHELDYNLDDHAFAFALQQYHASLEDLDDHLIESEYLPSLEPHLRTVINDANAEIFWFDYRRRSSSDAKSKHADGTKINLENRMITLGPIKAVHVDQTPAATLERVHRHTPHMVSEICKKRIRIINVWRPIGFPVESSPLAFMDGSTVPTSQLVEVDVVRRTFLGKSYYPLEGGGYTWHYMDHQTPDELLFMKMSDSKEDVRAKCNNDPSAKPRESIEVRALVFTDK